MKRFGRYDNDFNALFECYSLVNSDVVVERELPSVSRQKSTKISGESFPGLKKVKIFIQKPKQSYQKNYLQMAQAICIIR